MPVHRPRQCRLRARVVTPHGERQRGHQPWDIIMPWQCITDTPLQTKNPLGCSLCKSARIFFLSSSVL